MSITSPLWDEAEQMARENPQVYEALRNFAQEQCGNNDISVVYAVLNAIAAKLDPAWPDAPVQPEP